MWLDPVILVPVAFMTGLVGIGHFVKMKRHVPQPNETKQDEYRVTGIFFSGVSIVTFILLAVKYCLQ
ncbi:hypothetical protein EPO05_04500 [Patescibacteria group bacterium]|nr:MAG: hypothetical protein EPO05_04500 [Patescibacteria group bacterium]